MAEAKKPNRLRRKRREGGEPEESSEQQPDEAKAGETADAPVEADAKAGSEPVAELEPAAEPGAAAEPEAREAPAEESADAEAERPADAADEDDITAEDEDAKAEEEDDTKPEDDDAKAKAKEASRPKRRRGAAETSTRKEPARAAPRREIDGAVQVRAQAKYVRSAPRKARLVMNHIRGKRVDDARAILRHTPRAAATDIAKLLESAVANAENNFELDPDDLKIDRAFVDEGPTIKRFRPRALGRATPIHKRTSHMTITLTSGEGEE